MTGAVETPTESRRGHSPAEGSGAVTSSVDGARLRGYGLVLLAATLWATMGLFYRGLMDGYALSSLSIVFWRAALAAMALLAWLKLRRQALPHLTGRDWLLYLGFGLIGVAAFYVVYIRAVALTGMGVASVLMYTAPAWVTAFSAAFLGERLTPRRLLALILAVGGCALVGRVYDRSALALNLPGVLAGLGAGVTYGAYILFCRAASKRGHSPWAALFYALSIGAVALLPLQSASELAFAATTPSILMWLLVLGIILTPGGGIAFNAALAHVPASNASIVATLEPAIATGLGWLVFHEKLDPLQLAGAGLILAAVILLQLPSRRHRS